MYNFCRSSSRCSFIFSLANKRLYSLKRPFPIPCTFIALSILRAGFSRLANTF